MNIKLNEKQIEKLAKLILNEETEIKKGVDDVYEQNPELREIGTKKEYSNYLDTIFPNSKMRDIAYHATDSDFEHFDDSFLGKKDPGYYGRGFYFLIGPSALEGTRHIYFSYTNKTPTLKNIKMVLLNILNPIRIKSFDFSNTGKEFDDNIDGAIIKKQVVVKSSKQIHVLGGKKDIRKFNEYMKNKRG